MSDIYGGALGRMYDIDVYRSYTKGAYDIDFSSLQPGSIFPSNEVVGRNAVYRYLNRLYTGEYGKNKRLIALIDNVEQPLPYYTLSINYFKLIVNKVVSMIFANDVVIKTGDIERDKIVNKLIERTGWVDGIRTAIKKVEIYGDCPIKTYKYGVSAFDPMYAYKVVDVENKQKTIAYVLWQPIINKDIKEIEYIRIEIHGVGYIYERVYGFSGNMMQGQLGEPVSIKYRGREIKKEGNMYETGIKDCETVQWLSINKEADGVYGCSPLNDIKDIIFTLEQRLSSELWILNNHEKPFLILGMDMVVPDETTGGYRLKTVNGKYLISHGGEVKPEFLTWDGKLSESKQLRDGLLSYFYELSELGRTFLSGEYAGNISEETLANIIKSAIDRANRDINDIWYGIRDSLYVLCRLNDIEINKEDINIQFNIGRSQDDKQLAEIIKTFKEAGILSNETMLQKYFGMTSEQAKLELEKIKNESLGGVINDTDAVN